MNRYNVAAVIAGVASVIVAVLVGLVEPPYNRAISCAIVLMTTVPMAVLFSPFIFDVARGHGRELGAQDRLRDRPLDSADLFGAGVALIGLGVSIQYVRAIFFNSDQACGLETICYGVVSGLQVLLLAGACWFLLSAFSFVAAGARRRWLISVLVGSFILGVLAYVATVTG